MLKVYLEKDGFRFIADEKDDGYHGYHVTDTNGNWWYSYNLNQGNWDEIDEKLVLKLEQEYQGDFSIFLHKVDVPIGLGTSIEEEVTGKEVQSKYSSSIIFKEFCKVSEVGDSITLTSVRGLDSIYLKKIADARENVYSSSQS